MNQSKNFFLGFVGAILSVIQYGEIAQAATTVVNSRTSSGAVLTQTTTYSDGSKIFTIFDPDNQDDFSSVVYNYNPAGNIVTVTQTYDTNEKVINYFGSHDPALTWWLIHRYFNDAGQEEQKRVFYKNNTLHISDYDPMNVHPWRVRYTYNVNQVNTGSALSDGTSQYIDTRMDDGTRVYENFDYNSTQTWSKLTRVFDVQGREDHREYTMDSGVRHLYDYDQNKTQAWTMIIKSYDVQGREDVRDSRMDDGSRLILDFDQASQFTYSERLFEYNSAGALIRTRITNDDGTVSIR